MPQTSRKGRVIQPSLKAQEIAMAKNSLTQSAGVGKSAAKPKRQAATKSKGRPTSSGATKSASAAATAATSNLNASASTASAKPRGRPPGKAATAEVPAAKAASSTTKSANSTAAISAKVPAKRGRKRKDGNDDVDDGKTKTDQAPQAKRARVVQTKAVKPKVIINQVPVERLDVYVFGEGSNSELGLGTSKKAIDVKRPRLNNLLRANEAGIVSLAAGGMHVVALGHDGEVISWGVNDSGALGRNTAWEGGLKDIDDNQSDDSDDSDSGLNPYESTPTAIPINTFAERTRIVKLAAGDSVSLALTDDGLVYGWGTFRNHAGIMGFYKDQHLGTIQHQYTPRLYTELSKIVDIACGSNHCLALDSKGFIYVWGCGEQNQLGHHINERLDVENKAGLYPSLLRTGSRKYKAIYTGADHSFAIDVKGQVWSWGLNSFGATGIAEGAGNDNAAVYTPSLVKSLSNPDNPITFISGGQHHSIAITQNGEALVFGRVDGYTTGLDLSTVPSNSTICDEHGKPRIIITPTPIPNIGRATYAAAGSDHTIVLNDKGLAYSWGLSATYQTGQGTTADIEHPTHIDNTAVREKMLTWVGCGGQYSILASPSSIGGEINGDVGHAK